MRVLMGLAALAALGLAPAAAGAASRTYSQFYPGNNNADTGLDPQAFAPTDWDGTRAGRHGPWSESGPSSERKHPCAMP